MNQPLRQPGTVAELAQTPPKLPPQALEAEQALLGGLLLDNRKWDEISDRVGANDFYHLNHRLIYQAIGGLLHTGAPADVVTVCEQLEKSGETDQAGNFAYISQLANNTPSTANILAYAAIVRDNAILRALLGAVHEISDTAHAPMGKTPQEVLVHAEKLVFDIAARDGRGRRGFIGIPDLAQQSFDKVEERSKSGVTVTGVPTGFSRLDEMTTGLQKGELVVVAGRPSMGKTAFALNIAEYAAIGKDLAVAIFSMEMPAEQLATRLLSSVSGVDSNRIRTGRLTDSDWPRLSSAMVKLKRMQIFVDDTGGLTPPELASRARRIFRENSGISMIIIDYLQQMTSAVRNENRATEVAEITRSLKTLAKELAVPVVALSQLNRSLEQRPNKRPVMSDLRESGAIEQDADVIFFLYRDEVYNEDTEDKGVAEVIIGKQRNGPIGMAKLTFLQQLTRFENYADPGAQGEDMPPYPE